jgi:large subunit ribosomal protein L21
MYAVIKTGGKQYRVAAGDVITVEKLAGDVGEAVTFDHVLAVGGDSELTVGTPTVDGATVSAEVLEQGRGDKVLVFKKKRRQNYRRLHGHRQYQTVLRVTDIAGGGETKPKPKKAKAVEPAEATEPAVEAAAETEA